MNPELQRNLWLELTPQRLLSVPLVLGLLLFLTVVINEFLAHSSEPARDFIELYNRSTQEVDLSGCILTDSLDTTRFRIPPDTRIAPGQHLAWDEAVLGFALRAAGESIHLLSPDGRRVLDLLRFNDQENGVSTGRSPDGSEQFHRLTTPTPGSRNSPRRPEEIVINEIFYHPPGGDADEFIELHHRGTTPIHLAGWRIRGGIQFDFPVGTVIEPGQQVVIARNPDRLRANHPELATARVVGPYTGLLGNGGDVVRLSRPIESRTTNSFGVVTTEVLNVRVGEVRYFDGGAWGRWSDGGGSSLELTDPDAEPMWRYAKFWAQPIAEWFLSRPGNAVSETVSAETRAEVRSKVSRLVRGRWFAPPFSGARFSAMLYEALTSMAEMGDQAPLLPPGHPIDLAVTVTDFRGHAELLRLNSPAIIAETEHRLPITFHTTIGTSRSEQLADPLELVLAARATASFPGAFPPLMIEEIDRLAASEGRHWAGRGSFLNRTMPVHMRDGTIDEVALIDGSVLVNAPFGAALATLHGRPAQREVDRRFVYIDPRPDRRHRVSDTRGREIGFFGAIFGALSTIPREQPIRDSLAIDLPATLRCLRWFAEATDKLYDEVAPTAGGVP
jgi:hypothetical protein